MPQHPTHKLQVSIYTPTHRSCRQTFHSIRPSPAISRSGQGRGRERT